MQQYRKRLKAEKEKLKAEQEQFEKEEQKRLKRLEPKPKRPLTILDDNWGSVVEINSQTPQYQKEDKIDYSKEGFNIWNFEVNCLLCVCALKFSQPNLMRTQ